MIAVGLLDVPAGGDYYQTLTTVDQGATWMQGVQVEAIAGEDAWAVEVLSTGDILVGTDPFSTNMIYRSTDAGATWSPVSGQPSNALVSVVSVIREIGTAGVVLAGCLPTGGVGPVLYRSTDYGETWTRVAVADIVNTNAASATYAIQDILDLGSGSVVMGLGGPSSVAAVQWRMSTDSGATFAIETTLLDANVTTCPDPWQLALADDGSIISTGQANGSGDGEIWRGEIVAGPNIEWSRVATAATFTGGYGPFSPCVNTRDGNLLALLVLNTVVGVTPGGSVVAEIFQSTDNGQTWTDLGDMSDIRNNGVGGGRPPTCKLACAEASAAIIGLRDNVTGAAAWQFARSLDGGATWSGLFLAEGSNRVTDIWDPLPVPSLCDDDLTDADIISFRWDAGDRQLVNRVVCELDWDPDANVFTKMLIFSHDESIRKYGPRPEIRISSKGLHTDLGADAFLEERAREIFTRFGDAPPAVVQAEVFYRKHAWEVGDIICLTSDFIPNLLRGERGITEEHFELVDCRPQFADRGKLIVTLMDLEALTDQPDIVISTNEPTAAFTAGTTELGFGGFGVSGRV